MIAVLCMPIVLGAARGVGAEVVEIKVQLDAKCGLSHDTGPKKVYFSKHDVLVWNVASTCSSAQKVRLCMEAGKPLRKCNGEPSGANVGQSFTIGAGASDKPSYAAVTCHIDWEVLDDHPSPFPIEVLAGPANEELKCSPQCIKGKGKNCPEVSELALEVLP